MSIYGSAVKRPITTIMLFVALMVLGLYSLVKLPVDLYPEIEAPFMSVLTTYSGANASDIETNITRVIEDNLNTVNNVKEISSTSRDNTSVVFIEFEWGTDLDEAANDIRDALNFAEQMLPEDADKPSLFKFNSSMMPIMFYAITAKESYYGLDKILDERIVNPLNRIEGIGSISVMGAPGREIQVNVDPLRMEAYNLSVEQVAAVIQAENLDLPAGNIEMGYLDYPLRIEGEFVRSDVIENLVMGNFNGQTIYLRDIATVKDTIRDMTVDEKINGQTGLRMVIQKQSGANTVGVAREVRESLEELKKSLPADVTIEKIMDSSEFIQGSIKNLTSSLLYAAIAVVLVILFFLGRWRATFIVILTIPISLIVAFIYLRISGNSINIISLSSLSIAIGMVVDDAIVVLENITKHIERGSTPREAAIYATNEVWLAVIVTTLTVVAVFMPLTFISGLTGTLFRQLGLIVSITVVTSTIAAISITPMLASKLLRLRPKNHKPRKFSYDNTIIRLLDRFDAFYEKSIRFALRRKWYVLIGALVIFFGSLFLVKFIGTEFMPEADEGSFSATIELQSGIRVDETIKIARLMDDILEREIPEIELVSTSAGSDDRGGFMALFNASGSNIITYTIRLVDQEERTRDVWTIADVLRKELDKIPEIVNYDVTTSSGMGFGGGTQVEVEIYGYDINTTNQVADEISDRMNSLPGATDVNISRDDSKPELQVVLDQERMAQHGLSTSGVAMMLRGRVKGLTATRFREFGDEYDVVIRFEEEYRNSITDIENIAITNQRGETVRLKDIGSIQESWSPPSIDRKRRERIVSVTAKPSQTSLGELVASIQKELNQVDTPPDVMVQISGAYEDQQETFMDLGLLMVISLLLVYIVMASQFESLKMPFIIMFSIPFSFSGVILALYLTNTTLSAISALGAIMLIGIVVKNAIVLVDYINLMRDRGLALNEAISVAGRSRLRPVLMTSLTTILGMLPLALSTGEGSEIWSPMGIAVIGGLVFSTLVTLILVPVVYSMFSRRGERNKMKSVHSRYEFMNNVLAEAKKS